MKNKRTLQEQEPQGTKKKSMTAAERQQERSKKLKEDPEKYQEYLLKQKELMQKKRSSMSAVRKRKIKEKETFRKQLRDEKKLLSPEPAGSPQGYTTESSLNRAFKRVDKHLPKSPGKQRAVVKKLACKVKLTFPKKRAKEKAANAVAEQIKTAIKDFYCNDEVSQWAPEKAEYVTVRDENGKKTKDQKRYLQVTVNELYQLFKTQHPEVKVSKSMFCDLRPQNVLLSSEIPHSTCHCKYHENIFLYLTALNKIYSNIPLYSSSFTESMVCKTTNDECYFNKCDKCKDGSLFKQEYPLEINVDLVLDDQSDSNEDTVVKWYQWEDTKNSLGFNNLAKVLHEGDVTQLYESFIAALPGFLLHSFIKRKQASTYEDCKLKLPDHPAYGMMQFDFSQNMTCEWQMHQCQPTATRHK